MWIIVKKQNYDKSKLTNFKLRLKIIDKKLIILLFYTYDFYCNNYDFVS